MKPLRPLILIFLTSLCSIAQWTAASPMDPPKGILPLEPSPAVDFSLQDMDGEAYSLRQDRGQWVFVHFWASWCGPCRKEMPAIETMYQHMEGEGLKLALINTAEDEDTIFIFLSTLAPSLRPLMDRDGQVTELWRPRGLPATYLVDPQGRLRFQALGGRPWGTQPYLDFLRALIKQNSQP